MSHPLTLRTEAGDELLDLSEFELRARRGEVSPQSLVRFPAVTGEDFVPACDLELWRSLQAPQRAYFARTFSLTHFPHATALLILAMLATFLYTAGQGPLDIDAMVLFGAKVSPLIIDLGELHRLLIANFLHRDPVHIGMNAFVLFNVGAALENIYRRIDYLLLLLVSGIATMASSLFFSDAVTVGASGMVYGGLGALVVFGLRYRSILPAGYRRLLGDAAIPVVLILFWVGWTSVGVDSAAHVGGLSAGGAVAMFLSPKLLVDRPRARFGPMVRALAFAALIGLTFFGQGLLEDRLPPLFAERDDGFGIQVWLPQGWRRGTNRVGQLVYYNGLPGAGSATFSAEAIVSTEPGDAQAAAAQFAVESLNPPALGPDVLRVTAEKPEVTKVGEHDGLLVRATLDRSFGPTRLFAYFVPRGDLVYQLVFSYPVNFPRYGGVMDRVISQVHFDEPKSLREARARALLFPGAAFGLGQLGDSLRRLGAPHEAAEALRSAVAAEPSSAPFRALLALSLLQTGAVDEACRSSQGAVLYGPTNALALEADARCLLARGNAARALIQLQAAVAAAPGDVRLRKAEQALRAEVGE